MALFALTFVDADKPELTLLLLVIGVAMIGGIYSGFLINHMDISPIHAGTLMGIGNSLGNIFGFVAPLSVDVIANISGYNEVSMKEIPKYSWISHIIFFRRKSSCGT